MTIKYLTNISVLSFLLPLDIRSLDIRVLYLCLDIKNNSNATIKNLNHNFQL